MPFFRRQEAASAGFDDFLAGLPQSASTGLRVPAAVLPKPYRFLLDVVVLDKGDAVIGLSQLLTIAALVSEGETIAPAYPYEREVVTPTWHFPDAQTMWTLTAQSESAPRDNGTGPHDQDTFVFRDTDTPALVYDTAHFPAVPTAPGYLGLDGYTPPAMQGIPIMWMRDIRFPWQENHFDAMRFIARRPMRFRLYLDLLQSNPATRFMPSPPGDTQSLAAWPSLAPEDLFNLLFPESAVYFRAAARIIIERAMP